MLLIGQSVAYISNEDLIWKIYKETIYQKNQIIKFNMGYITKQRILNLHIVKDWKTFKWMFTIISHKEMKIKITLRFKLIPFGMAKISHPSEVTNHSGEDMEQEEQSSIADVSVVLDSHWGTQYEVPQKRNAKKPCLVQKKEGKKWEMEKGRE